MEPEKHSQPNTVIAGKSEAAEILCSEEGNLTPKGGKEMKGKESEGEKIDCVIDIKRVDESLSGDQSSREKVCRICHLGSSENPSNVSLDMIQLGCGCKDELGFSHLHCAEKWFKQRGNRQCEICGKAAKNINVVEEDSTVVHWNEMRLMTATTRVAYSEREGSCLCKNNLCNILLACLVMAFVLPWFIRISFK